jgi:transposase-like protein
MDGKTKRGGGVISSEDRQRRRFTDEYKESIVEEWNNTKTPEERQAILDREDLYSSYIYSWKTRYSENNEYQNQFEKLERENKELRKKISRYEALLKALQNVHVSLTQSLEGMDISDNARQVIRSHLNLFNTIETLEKEVHTEA